MDQEPSAGHSAGDDDNDPLREDFYTLLNISRQANIDEINNAYRQSAKLFHPDKQTEPLKKKEAEIVFNRIKRAHEVLKDERQRAIYDTLGIKGLETEGWQIVKRTQTAEEIREEYQRLVKEREERHLQQRTNPHGVISLGINATELFAYKENEFSFDPQMFSEFPYMEVSSMAISQSIEAPLTGTTTGTLSGALNAQNGRGSGTLAASLRHIVSSKTWAELQFAVGQGPIITIKGFRTISKRFFMTTSGFLHFGGGGSISPGVELVIGRQLDKNLVGYMTWKGMFQRSLNTTIVWDNTLHNFAFGVQIGKTNTFFNASYTRKFPENTKVRGTIKAGVFGARIEYGCETKLSQHSVIGATMSVGVPNGVTLKIKVNRANQNFMFPILLSDELLPNAIFYGTVVPIITYFGVKALIIDPYMAQEKKREIQKSRSEHATKLIQRKKEAESVILLLKETYIRIVEQETQKAGLVVERAIYGKTKAVEDSITEVEVSSPDAVDVTLPLQCLIRNSNLTLPSSSKSNLPGFYDPCLGDDKKLYVKYKYRNLVHQVTFEDCHEVDLPNSAHLNG